MRFIPRNCIPPEAILAKSILGVNGEILLREGTKMRASYIDKLKALGIGGAYVSDPISEDLEIVGALSEELRAYAVRNICSVYSKTPQSANDATSSAIMVMKMAEVIVDEILSHGEVMLNLFDMKAYDSYTFYHCVNVTVLSVVIGMGAGIERDRLKELAYSALMHDIGKVFIAPRIINKPGKLTDEEFDEIKKHPKLGYDYIKEKYFINMSETSARGALEHHERFNGTGYPERKRGKQITDFGRIIAVADVYDALISDRPYRSGMFPVEAMEYVQGASGSQFDHEMVEIFSRKVALFPVGTSVRLSNNSTGLVMANYEGLAQRPLLKIFKQDDEDVNPYFLNLSTSGFDVTIISMASA